MRKARLYNITFTFSRESIAAFISLHTANHPVTFKQKDTGHVVIVGGFEPPAYRLGGGRSIQLSYTIVRQLLYHKSEIMKEDL